MALPASNSDNVSRPAVNFVFLIRVILPFVLAPRKRIKILHPRGGKHDLTTLIQTRKKASRLYLQQQKEWHKCIKKSIYLSHASRTACNLPALPRSSSPNDLPHGASMLFPTHLHF